MIGLLDWQRPELLWLVLSLELFSCLVLFGFDRLGTRGMPFNSRVWLFAIRFGALTLLAISLLRPVLSLREPAARRGVVAVMVDESASMGVVDTQRSPAKLTPLAAALDPAVAALRNPALAELHTALQSVQIAADNMTRALSELEYAKLSQRSLNVPQERLAATQRLFEQQRLDAISRAQKITAAKEIERSLEAIDALSATTQSTRISAALRNQADAVEDLQFQSDEHLCEQNPSVRSTVETYASESRLQLIKRCLARAGPAFSRQFSVQYFGFGVTLRPAISPGDFSADQAGTDLPGSIRELRQRLVGQRLAAIVICSDGRQNEAATSDVGNSGDLPVYAINAGLDSTQDVACTSLSLPRAIFSGTPATATVRLSVALPKPVDSQLSISLGDRNLYRPVHLSGPTTRESFSVQCSTVGPSELIAAIEPQSREATSANNSFRSWTRVTNQPIRVGIVTDSGSPNLASLQKAFSGDPAWAIQTLATESIASNSDLIFGEDIIVLSNLPYDALPASAWVAIQRFARERGGAVLIDSAEPALYVEYSRHESSASLLTWSGDASPILRRWPSSIPALRLAPANAEAIETLRWADDPEDNRQAWRNLPRLSRAVTFPDSLPTAQPLIAEAQSRAPLLVTQPIGPGRVALLGCDEVDRWQSPRLFWQRLLGYLSGGAYAVDDGVLAIDVDTLAPKPDRPLHLRLKVIAGARAELEEAFDRPLLQVNRDGKRYFSQLLNAPADAYPIRSDLTLPNLPAGDYQFALLWADRKVTLPLTVADSLAEELSNVTGDSANLASLVSLRGAVLPIEDLPTLPARIESEADPSPVIVTYPLWDSPYFFILVIGCFGADWALRQRLGLA